MGIDELLDKNMEFASVIRSLRKNAREDAEQIARLERERDEARSLTEHQWLLKVGSRLFVAGCKSDGIIDSLDEIIRERDEAREKAERYRLEANAMMLQRDEARDLLRILAGLVAYGLGQSGEEWSLDAMRQATAAIQNAKSLEEVTK